MCINCGNELINQREYQYTGFDHGLVICKCKDGYFDDGKNTVC